MNQGEAMTAAQTEILLDHLALVDEVVRCLKVPDGLTADDLWSAGVEGLMRAVRGYTPERYGYFRRYVRLSVRCGVIDYLRRHRRISKNTAAYSRRRREVVATIEQSQHCEASELDVQKALGLSGRRYEAFKRIACGYQLLSLEESIPNAEGLTLGDVLESEGSMEAISATLEREDARSLVSALIASLPAREGALIRGIYFDGKNQEQMAVELDLTSSRICQILKTVLKTFKRAAELREYLPGRSRSGF